MRGRRLKHETVVILDFGGQYTQLLARRIRELKVYCAILPHHASLEQIQALNPQALVLSGGAKSLYDQNAPTADPQIYRLGLPVLGIGYGMPLMARDLGGEVVAAGHREYRPTTLRVLVENELFAGLERELTVGFSHYDRVETAPPGFSVLAATDHTPVAAMGNRDTRQYAVQFHPEAFHTQQGTDLLKTSYIRSLVSPETGRQQPLLPIQYGKSAKQSAPTNKSSAAFLAGLTVPSRLSSYTRQSVTV